MTILASSITGVPDALLPMLSTRDARIRLMPSALEAVSAGGVHAMTLGSTVFVARERFDAVAGGEAAELVAHELIHVRQWREHGPLRFLATYVADYCMYRAMGLSHDTAYRCIRFEAEAYDEAGRMVAAP